MRRATASVHELK